VAEIARSDATLVCGEPRISLAHELFVVRFSSRSTTPPRTCYFQKYPQDNLEFCQWLKAFYDQSGVYREDYNAAAVRARGKGGKQYAFNNKKSLQKQAARPAAPVSTTATRRATTTESPTKLGGGGIRESRALRERLNREKPVLVESTKDASNSNAEADKGALLEHNVDLQAKNADLEANNAKLEADAAALEDAVVEIEKERDFYFGKLRNVEILLQIFQESGEKDSSKVLDDVFKILYAVRPRMSRNSATKKQFGSFILSLVFKFSMPRRLLRTS
jgi:hypothetical protein